MSDDSIADVADFDFAVAAVEVMRRCDVLAGFSEEPGQITRTFLSPPMRDVHRTVGVWMAQAGLSVRIDSLGTIIGESAGVEDGPVLLIGSHLDTIRNAGRYDGILGVLLGIATAAALNQIVAILPYAIHVAGFSEEEGVRFPPYISSRAVSGTFDAELLELRDAAGKTLREAIVDFGLDPTRIPGDAYEAGRLVGYVEAHIEQGPRLEDAGLRVAAVDGIAGQTRMLLRVTGKAGHAGTCPMPLRRDALTGAAELILAIENLARDTEGLVATVGQVETQPNISNVIPGSVTLSADIRHKDDVVRVAVVNELKTLATGLASRRGLEFLVDVEKNFAAVPMDPRLVGAMQAAIEAITGDGGPILTSGAGHDASVMAAVTAAAMLFVRSPNGGLSHHPDEAVFVDDVAIALRVLVRFILGLAESSTSA